MYEGYKKEDFEEAITGLEKLLDQERVIAEIELFSAWAKHNPEEVLAYIKGNKGMMNFNTEIKSILYGIWAESDPEGAIKSFGVMVPSSIFYEASWYRGIVPSVPIAIAKSIARSDPERATEYIKEQHLKRYFNLVSEYLINLYHNDKQIAYQQLDHFSGEAKLTGISGIAGVWGKEEEWVDIQGKINDLSPDLQDVARSSAMKSIAKKNAFLAQQAIDTLEIEREKKEELVIHVFDDMVEKDVMVNLEWAMQNTSEDSYYRLLEKALESRNVENKWGSTSEGTSIDKRVELFIDAAVGSGDVSSENIEKLENVDTDRLQLLLFPSYIF